jgi:8-oxo-dGTP diphosphatase
MVRLLVGVGVLVYRRRKLLLGKRKGSHGAATWALPGGHLEAGETIEACAVRETAEETGLAVGRIRHAGFTSDVFADENKHYVTLFVEAGDVSGIAVLLEPDKCDAWDWFAWDDLPEPLFAPLQSLVNQDFRPAHEE